MSRVSKSFVILAVAAFAAVLADPAFAGGRHKSARARTVVPADATSTAAGATLMIRMEDASSTNWELRLQLHGAPAGLAPELFIADATGTLVDVGALAADNSSSSEYRLRLRGKKGATLPAGAATLTDLGGRAFEIQDSGVAILTGTLPSLASTTTSTTSTSTSTSGSSSSGSDDNSTTTTTTTGGSDDGASHDANESTESTESTEHSGSSTTSGASGTSTTTTTTTSDDSSGHDGGSSGNSGSGNSGGGHGGNDGSGHH